MGGGDAMKTLPNEVLRSPARADDGKDDTKACRNLTRRCIGSVETHIKLFELK
jgi:hypothetical protein